MGRYSKRLGKRYERAKKDRISLNLISENNRRVTIDNAIVITEEE